MALPSLPVNAWLDWRALSTLSKLKIWDMWHSYLAVYYWNDPEVLTLPGPLFIFNIFLPVFTVHSPSLKVYRPVITVHCPFLIVYHPVIKAHYLSLMVYCPVFTVHCPSLTVYFPVITGHCPKRTLQLSVNTQPSLPCQRKAEVAPFLRNRDVLRCFRECV